MRLVVYFRAALQYVYDRVIILAANRYAYLALFSLAFAESSLFPIPPHVILIPMALADKAKAWKFAAIATSASVLGGFAGYMIGYCLFDLFGKSVLIVYGGMEKFDAFRYYYNNYGAWIVFFAGVTPFPYKVVTIASGVMKLDLVVFLLASFASRGLVFFTICGLIYFFGRSIRVFIEERLSAVTLVFFSLFLAIFLVTKYLVY